MRVRNVLLLSLLPTATACGLREVRLAPQQIATLDFGATSSLVCANNSDAVLQVAVHYRDGSRLVLRRDDQPADALIEPRELAWSSTIGSVDPHGVLHLPADRREWLRNRNEIRVAVARAPQFAHTLVLTPHYDCGEVFLSGPPGATGKPGAAGPDVSVVLSYYDAEAANRRRVVLTAAGLDSLRDTSMLLDGGLPRSTAVAPRVARDFHLRAPSGPAETGSRSNFVMARIVANGKPPAIYLLDAKAGRRLQILARGGDGGAGANGSAGANGLDGLSGMDGASGSLCSDGGNGTNGGDGANGGDGGNGGPGGIGGIGGNVNVEFDARFPELPKALAISVDGGRGGRGGPGGEGGRGGQGGRAGRGGSGGTTCTPPHTSHSGSDGTSGQSGRNGHNGSAGHDGLPGSPGKIHIQAVPANAR